MARTGQSIPLGHFFSEAESLRPGAVEGQIRNGVRADKIIVAVIGAVKSQDSHQEEAGVEKILGDPDPIPVLKPDNGLMFR